MLRKNKKAGYAAAMILCGFLSACTSAEQSPQNRQKRLNRRAEIYISY